MSGVCQKLVATLNVLFCAADTYKFCHAADSRVEQTLLQFEQKVKEEIKEIREEIAQQPGKRHRTGFTETPIHLADGE